MTHEWDLRFMQLAYHFSTWSKDPSTKVGAVIVNERRIIIGTGYNGFPRGVNDSPEILADRPAKYARTVHAEANAVLNASASTQDGTIYITAAPCASCTTLLIQAGIRRIVHPVMPPSFVARWSESFEHSKTMLAEAGVHIEEIQL